MSVSRLTPIYGNRLSRGMLAGEVRRRLLASHNCLGRHLRRARREAADSTNVLVLKLERIIAVCMCSCIVVVVDIVFYCC
jgi:hypothetical protein